MPAEVLAPRDPWPDKRAYDEQARRLAGMFRDNFGRYADEASPEIRSAEPKV